MSCNEIILISDETRAKIIDNKNENEIRQIKRNAIFKTIQLLKKRKINLDYLKSNVIDNEYRYKQKENIQISKELVEQFNLIKTVINYKLSFKDFIEKVAEVIK